MNIRKEAKNKHFRKLLPKQVIKVTLRSSNSPNKNGRSGCHKLIKSINKVGITVGTQARQDFPKSGSPSIISISFQKWLLQKLPKHPPNNLHSSSTIGKPFIYQKVYFLFQTPLASSRPTFGQETATGLFSSAFSDPKPENWCKRICFMEVLSGSS